MSIWKSALLLSLVASCVPDAIADEDAVALEYHSDLVSRTVGIPSFVGGKVSYDPTLDDTRSTGPGEVTYQIPLDGGMRPRFISVEVAGDLGSEVEATAIMLDHSDGTKRTISGNDPGAQSFYHWIDIPLADITGATSDTGSLPRKNQAILTVRVEFADAGSRTRRVVMFYDRPAPSAVPLPPTPPILR